MESKKTHLQILTEKEMVAADTDQTIDVLLRVLPPSVEAGGLKRPKLNFGIALDRSGSMGGHKMAQAREAAKYCVDELLPTDTFSAVIFDGNVDVLFTNQPVANKEMLKRGIDRIEARGSTALHEGWVQAGIQVSERLSGGGINRVLLITDGQANVGEARPDRIVEQAKALAERGISTSTIGIGQGFNEDLLVPMAEAGQGNAWYVEEPQDMVRIFETELKGLVAQVGHTVTLGITPSPGVKVEDLLNDFETDASGRYILPNIRAGSPLDVLVRLKIPAGKVGETFSAAIFELRYTEQATQKPMAVTAEAEVVYDTAAAVAELRRNDQVLEAVTLLTNARARKEAMEYMDRGRFEDAQQVLFDRELQTDALFSLAPSLELEQEIEAVRDLNRLIADRSNDLLTRKRMSYERDLRRKSR
ncbi:MAG: VWA domain-containing protein [Acidobacteria bacterium]|nr:VWA domain-containing protein [Acidobacteriota bacterium]